MEFHYFYFFQVSYIIFKYIIQHVDLKISF